MSRHCGIFLLFAFATGIPWARGQDALPANSATGVAESSSGPSSQALRISAGDLLDLNVFDTAELSAKLRVDENGNVTLPLAGVLRVSGMTAEQARLAIEAHL